jgi:CRP-like cAMP-binding protein
MMQYLGKTAPANDLPAQAMNNRLLAAMPSEAFMLLEPDLQQITLPQGTVCFGLGDRIEQIYFPQSGIISRVIPLRDGDVVEIALIGREGAVGLQSGLGLRHARTSAVVQTAGRFVTLATNRLEQAVDCSPALRDLIIGYIEALWAEAQQNVACNAAHDSASRLCRWLLQCAEKIGGEQILLTQEILAEMLGVRRTTVTLLAQDLQKNGFIRYSRGRITILDRRALEARACECYMAFQPLPYK